MSRDRQGNPMPRGLGSLLLLLIVLSCTSGMSYYDRAPVVPTTGLELAPSERAEEQRRSLTHVFYRDNGLPPTPSARELRRLEHNLGQAPQVEVDELRALYGNDVELLAWATRDSDGDGVLDFRISHYRGKFFEGDLDLDNDGIRNVYDAAPYDRRKGGKDTNGDGVPDKPGSFADADHDGIPDHIDWSGTHDDALAELQTGLFRDFGVIMVERSASFSPTLAQAVDDTLRLVFREPIATLRTVAVEDQLLISPDLGDNGLMIAQTQSLTIYTHSITKAEPLVVFGLLVHEVAHAWQLAQDYDAGDLLTENRRIHYPPGKFTGSLERFGWEADPNTLGEGYAHRLYWPHFYATSPRYLYRGSAPNEWRAWFEDVEREAGPEFLRESAAVTWGMVGPYSLTSPWEWHADQLMASIFNRIDRGIGEHQNRTYRSIASLLRARMLQAVRNQWYRFDYRNAVGTSIDRELAKQFPLNDAEIERLVDRYVIPLADLPMLSRALQLESEELGIATIRESLADDWQRLREQAAEPLAARPDLHALVQLGIGPWRTTPGAGAGGAPGPGAGGDHADDAGTEDSDSDTDTDTDGATIEGSALEELAADEAPPTDEAAAAEPPPPVERGGAGRVGGITPDEAPGEASSKETPELPEGPVRKVVDPVLILIEQLRSAESKPAAQDEAEAEPLPEPPVEE